jgi:tetratricopeptide (TPR) repeat protein
MRLYNALADGLSRGRDKSLVLWRMGSCLRRLDKPQATEEIMALIQDRWPDSAGAYRAALTSNDITVLKDWDKLGPGHVAAYSEIVDQGPTRELRQEAAFKQILVVNQMGRKQRAIECLGDFLDNFGATRLAIQAKVLAGELLPGVVGSLLDRGQIVQGLALVAKYREVLVHTRMPYPFLSQVGSMFEQLGLYERSARVFSYILARSQDPRRRAEILPRMVRLARQQMDPVRVQSYARDYLQEFPEGQKRSQVIAAAAEVLLQTGQAPKALEWLRDSRRPPDRDLDLLTARVLYAAGRYAEMDHYLKRARKSEGPLPARIRNIWAEALFRTRRFELALPVWRSLFADQTFGPRALYRAAEGLSRLGKFNQAAKLYARLDDKKKDSLWKDLAEQGRLINQVQGIMASQE